MWAYSIGSAGISLGLLILGFKVMETLGKKVVQLDYAKGFAAQFAAGFSINVGTAVGLPLSTTHCIVGALGGLVVVQKVFPSLKDIEEFTFDAETSKCKEVAITDGAASDNGEIKAIND